MTLLTTELPLVTNSDDDDSYGGDDSENLRNDFVDHNYHWAARPLFEKMKDRSALGTAPV